MRRSFPSKTLPRTAFFAALALLLAWPVVYPLASRAARQLSAFSGDRLLPDAVLTDTEAFLPLNAEMIVGAHVTDNLPSPDGGYLLAERMQVDFKGIPDTARPPEGECSLVLWNRRTRRTSVVWKSPLNEQTFADVDRMAWLSGSEVALAEITVRRVVNGAPQEQSQLLRISAGRATAAPVTAFREGEEIHVSPALPLALLSRGGREGANGWFRVLHASGSVGAPVALPPRADLSGFWNEDGTKAIVIVVNGSAADRTRRETYFEADPRTGAIRPLPRQPASMTHATENLMPPDTLRVYLKSSSAIVKEGETTRRLHPLWLESGSSGGAQETRAVAPAAPASAAAVPQKPARGEKQTRALIAADAESGFLMPDGKTCIYEAQGALYAVPILRVNKTAYLEAHRKAMRHVATSNAKQVGLAMMMYAQDYDEMYPPPDSNVRDLIMPYVKNDAVFNDPSTGAVGLHFQYTAAGLADIQKPAETILGYITGPGGRAIIYADGHVTWQDD